MDVGDDFSAIARVVDVAPKPHCFTIATRRHSASSYPKAEAVRSQLATGLVQKLKILLSENLNRCYDPFYDRIEQQGIRGRKHRTSGTRAGAYHTAQSFFMRGKDAHIFSCSGGHDKPLKSLDSEKEIKGNPRRIRGDSKRNPRKSEGFCRENDPGERMIATAFLRRTGSPRSRSAGRRSSPADSRGARARRRRSFVVTVILSRHFNLGWSPYRSAAACRGLVETVAPCAMS
jgi:hypothetical protein